MLITQSIFKTLALISHVSDLELFSDSVSLYKKNHPDINYAGSYKRMMISVSPSSGKREEISVSIIRSLSVDTDGSVSSSAIIPDILIPYASYTIRFVLTVLHAYLNRSGTISDLCYHFGISPSTLYDWIRLFEAHFASWEKNLLNARKLHNDLLSSINSIPSFPKQFLILFGIPFLRSRYRCFDIMDISHKDPPTA